MTLMSMSHYVSRLILFPFQTQIQGNATPSQFPKLVHVLIESCCYKIRYSCLRK